jgi:alpha-mannosidase
MLAAAEWVNAVAAAYGSDNMQYRLDRAWEPVLFNQVHDVICGVETDKVFQNTLARYRNAEFIAQDVCETQLEKLCEQIDTSGEGIPIIVFNQLGWKRKDVAAAHIAFSTPDVYEICLADNEGAPVDLQMEEIQRYTNGSIKQAKILFMAEAPAVGYQVYRLVPGTGMNPDLETDVSSNNARGTLEFDDGLLENEFYRIKTDLWNGQIKSIELKETGEELIGQENPIANAVVKESDDGDFWEIGAPLRAAAGRPINRLFPLPDKAKANFSTEHGGVGHTSHGRIKAEFGYSQKSPLGIMTTRVSIFSASRKIEITTTLVNHDKNVRYRVVFPTAIRAGRILHEIPFGSLERPEGEFPAQNWMDYTDSDKGLALLNCGLPGNCVIDNNMFLSLLKCTSFVQYGPAGGYDPTAASDGGYEIGKKHEFHYGLIPHKSDWKQAELSRAGQEFNNPLIVRKRKPNEGSLPSRMSFICVNKSQALITAIKRTDNGGLIVRLYESSGTEIADVRLKLAWKIESALEVDLIEQEISGNTSTLVIDANQVQFDMRAFEIKTLLFKLDPS